MTEKKTSTRKKTTAAKAKKVTRKVSSETASVAAKAEDTVKTTQAAKQGKTENAPPVKETPAETVQPTNVVPQAAPAPQPASGGGGKGLAAFALLLALGSLGLSGYLLYSNVLQQKSATTNIAVGVTEIKNNVQRFGETVAKIQSDVGSMDQRLAGFATTETVEQTVQTQVAPFAEQQKAAEEALQQLRQEVSGDQGRFAYDRVRQLLETANSHIGLHRDVDRALVALQLAEGQLQSLKDERLITVRTKVLAEISELEGLQLPDMPGLAARLNQMIKLVPEWPLQNEPNAELIVAEEGDSDAAASIWSRIADAGKTVFKEVVQVNKVDAPPKPLLAPEQRYFLNQNLSLRLLSAQQALLQQQQTVFEDNLNEAMVWITEYFDSRDVRVQNALTELTDIQSVTLRPELPDVSGSLTSLNQVLGD